MGKTVNYQCNLGISKVIETLDEDENIVEGLSQEAGNPHILSQDPSWADLLREDVTVSGSDAECEGHSNEDGMEETVTQDVMAGELRMVKVELGRMKRKYDDMVGQLRDKVECPVCCLVLLVRYSDMETSFSVLMLEENLWRYKVEITVRNSVKDKTSQDVISYSFKGQPNSITVENKYDLVGLDLSKKSFNRVLTKSRKLFWILQLAIEKAAELQTP